MIRTKNQLTREQLANMMGVTITTIYHWETGRREPNFKMLKKLSSVLNCAVGDLI